MPQNKYYIKNLLNSNLKNHILPEKKSGTYQINFMIYRKNKGDLETSAKEHFRKIKSG